MPSQFEDTHADITGDPLPTRPLTPTAMRGAQKAKVNQMRVGGPPGGGRAGAIGARAQNGSDQQKADDSQQAKPGDQQQQPGDQQGQQQPKGLLPAWDALTGGLGDIFKDPNWQQHPLLHLLTDAPEDHSPLGLAFGGKNPQDVWAVTQWWGRVLNSFYDPNQIHNSMENISHDNSIQAQIASRIFMIQNDQQGQFAMNVLPYALTFMAEWEPWMWGPTTAAQAPGQLNQVPGAAASLFGTDLSHPQFADPEWYARMGGYALAAIIAGKTGGKGVGPLLKFSGRLKALEPFVSKAERFLGGPGEKTPIKGPDGQIYDPNVDANGHAFASWWNDNIAPVEEGVSPIGTAATKEDAALIAHPEIDNAYVKAPTDPTARSDFARLLGLAPNATPAELEDKFFAMVERRELSPATSAKIIAKWDRFGSVIGQRGHIGYWHDGEAPLRNVLTSLKAIEDTTKQDQAAAAMRAANGFRAALWRGVHGYGNNLVEALVKGALNHGRLGGHYAPLLAARIAKVLPTTEENERVQWAVEAFNVSAEEGQKAYDALSAHEKWGVDLYRRLAGEVRAAKMYHGLQLEAHPNFFYRVIKRNPDHEAILKGIPQKLRTEAGIARGNTPFGYASRAHRASQLTLSPEGKLQAEAAYPTTQASNLQRAAWRAEIKASLKMRAAFEGGDFAKIINDPRKLDALAYAEIPDFSTNVLDSILGDGRHGLFADAKSLYAHQVLEAAKRTLVHDDRDGRWHPLAVSRSEGGQESSPTLSEHFKSLHDADTTTDFYRKFGYQAIEGFGAGHIFHGRYAGPLNRSLRYAKGDVDGAMKALLKLSSAGKHMIMLNPAWHSTNMAGRFGWLTTAHPQEVANAILKARGMKELNPEQALEWWDAQEFEAMEHGMLPPQLNQDVVEAAGKHHTLASGDVETGSPLDGKVPVTGFDKVPAFAGAVNAVKGADHWWQQHINDHMWNQIHQFGVLSYIALKDDAVKRGMAPGDARIYAASQANSWAGMVSPDRWMYSPAMHNLSMLLLFAPNWWRTFPRIILNSYDRMGMTDSPALTHAWALNTAKTIGAMILMKGATDNVLNWLMSGHWQFQNPQGYQNQVTMDRFAGVDPKTGAHTVMENPFVRQVTDLERVLGMEQAMKEGQWHPQFAEQGTAEVALARASPLVQMLETASNLDLYNSVKQRALRWVDPSNSNVFGSTSALMAGLLNLTPMGYTAQTAIAGATATPQQLTWGPFAGTTVPGWAARAFDPNDPMVPLLSLLGVRGGYPAPVKAEGQGLSSYELQRVAQIKNDWDSWLAKHQTQVMSGGMTFSEFAYQYKQQAAFHNGQLSFLGNTSDYLNGSEGLLSKYEAIYSDKQAFDTNGDINWAYVTQKQNQLQAQTDPGTWRQMMALKNQTEMQYPVLRAYKDSLQNYHNFQDTWAHANGSDGETLRSLIAQGYGSPNLQQFEASHPLLREYSVAKRQWELDTKQGFAYGLFSNNSYVMRVIDPSGDPQVAAKAEDQILPQIEQMEQQGSFVTPSGQ